MDSVRSLFPVRDIAVFPGLLLIFLHGCEIKSESDLARLETRLEGASVGRNVWKRHSTSSSSFVEGFGDILGRKILASYPGFLLE